MVGGYAIARDHDGMWIWLALIGVCQGVFALFTMYLPPLFPTLLRTTGAGFCYNIGRTRGGGRHRLLRHASARRAIIATRYCTRHSCSCLPRVLRCCCQNYPRLAERQRSYLTIVQLTGRWSE